MGFNQFNQLFKLIKACCLNEINNFAAYTSGSGMFNLPLELQAINGLAVAKILGSILECDSSIRFSRHLAKKCLV